MRICQLQNMSISILIQSFCIIALFGCAETPTTQQIKPKNEKPITAKWFDLPPRFASTELNDKISIHPFYDVEAKIDDFNKMPFIVSTPEKSKVQYELDIPSGKLYRERTFCAQDDIWKNYNEDLTTPNFTQGFIPRVYDEEDGPQRVIIFSDKDSPIAFKEQPQTFSEAKILGSVILESCEKYPCDLKEAWKPTQILVGVSTTDEEYNSLETMSALKNKVDWDYAKAMLTNMRGYNNIGGKKNAAYKILKELSLKDSIDYFKKNSFPVTPEKYNEVLASRTKCMDLYDSIWDSVEKIRTAPHGQAEDFLKYFKDSFALSANQFYQCQKLIAPANILENTRRFWFFAYLEGYSLLDHSGLFYNCGEFVWASGFKVGLERCRASNFERAFDQMVNGMSLMRTQTNAHYRFIEYDNLAGGSHQKIYGWVYNRPQIYACKNPVEASNQIQTDIFPQDVRWEHFKQDEAGVVR
jgi:hypothetical protein